MNRRQFLTLGSSSGILFVAGCSSTDPQTTAQKTETAAQTDQITEATAQTPATPSASTKTSTEQPPQAVKALSQSFYTNDGTFGVEGEVKNVTDRKIMVLDITIKFFSDKGIRIASGDDRLHNIALGQTVSYHAATSTTDVSPQRVGDWTLTFDATITSGRASIPVVDVLSKERYTTKTGQLGLRGQVKNISDETININLNVAFFTDHGETLTTVYGEITELQPGKVARYDLRTRFSIDIEKVQDYKLTIRGWK